MEIDIHRLSIYYATVFSDPTEVPARFRGSKRKTKDDTKILNEFKKKIRNWELTLTNISDHFNLEEAERIIKISPKREQNLTTVVEACDFNIINDYLILRRDIENCGDGELGCLALLADTIQKVIEEQTGLRKTASAPLKNLEAQKLREQKQIEIDGVEINLWQNHSIDSVKAQEGWNKVRSYAERNKLTTGENGDITFTGIMQIPRSEAEGYALNLGFKVHRHISKNIEYVVTGSENVSPTKMAEVINLQKEGAPIRVIGEIEFLEMVADNFKEPDELLEPTI